MRIILSFLICVFLCANDAFFVPSFPLFLRKGSSTSGSSLAALPNEPQSLVRAEQNGILNKVVSLTSAFYATLLLSASPLAVQASVAAEKTSPQAPTSSSSLTKQDGAPKPQITDIVYLDIKIANYTEESVGTNKGASGSGRIAVGLYGKAAPKAVALFLSTVASNGEASPSYINSQFTKISPEGLLEMERVRGVNKIDIGGSEQYEYMGNVLTSFVPIIESNGLLHNRKGLLTRRQLTATPEFGITLSNTPALELDMLHSVFGEVLEGLEVLDAITNIPTYSYTTATGYGGKEKGKFLEIDNVADKWFQGQKEFYVNLGRSFGDGRAIDQRGKLLRRVVIKGASASKTK